MMAEFREVMKQWVRVRKATASNLDGNVLSVYPLEDYDDRLIADIEKNVMQWAVDHPEPVYPTWSEWLLDVGGGKKRRFESRGYAGNTEVVSHDYYVCALDIPIPSDLAQKLGIEPKAGGNT